MSILNRTFGCVRVVWNRTLAARRARWDTERKSTSYAETDRALTEMKQQPDLAFLGEVSSVPSQQTLRHQHTAITAFYAKRARHPRYKSRHSRQSASYTRLAFRLYAGHRRLRSRDAQRPPQVSLSVVRHVGASWPVEIPVWPILPA